jgi:DNA-binding transcriptional regulator YiaG
MTDKPDRRALKTMDAEGYRAALDALGLSQVSAARFLDVNEKTSRDWASSNHADGPPAPVAKFLRAIAATGWTPHRIDDAIHIWAKTKPDAF